MQNGTAIAVPFVFDPGLTFQAESFAITSSDTSKFE